MALFESKLGGKHPLVDTTAIHPGCCGCNCTRCVTAGGVCLAASTCSRATVANSMVTTSGQTFQISASPVTMAGQVITAKLPIPANSKIVTVNMPTTQGGMDNLAVCMVLAGMTALTRPTPPQQAYPPSAKP